MGRVSINNSLSLQVVRDYVNICYFTFVAGVASQLHLSINLDLSNPINQSINICWTGVGIGSVQMQLDRPLASKLRISNVPAIVGVVDGRLRYFGSMYSVSSIRSFVRKQFYPPDTVEKVSPALKAASAFVGVSHS